MWPVFLFFSVLLTPPIYNGGHGVRLSSCLLRYPSVPGFGWRGFWGWRETTVVFESTWELTSNAPGMPTGHAGPHSHLSLRRRQEIWRFPYRLCGIFSRRQYSPPPPWFQKPSAWLPRSHMGAANCWFFRNIQRSSILWFVWFRRVFLRHNRTPPRVRQFFWWFTCFQVRPHVALSHIPLSIPAPARAAL